MKLDKHAKEMTINWLNGMQSMGAFEGFPENELDFETLPDDELAYYFIEWYFTSDYISELSPDEIDTDLLQERNRLLQEQ